MGGFLKWWVSSIAMGFPTKNDPFWGCFGVSPFKETPLPRVIAMENGPFEDVFPIENSDIPASYVSLPEGIKIQGGFPDPCFLLEDFFVLGRVKFRSRFLRWRPKHHKFPRLPRSVATYLKVKIDSTYQKVGQ